MSHVKTLEQGSVSFRLFYLNVSVDASIVDKFAEGAAPSFENLDKDPIIGWVEGKRLLGRNINNSSCVLNNRVFVNLVKAEKKVPTALLDIKCSEEEEIEKKARGADFLPKRTRSEIKQRVIETLRPDMPLSISMIPVVVDIERNMVIAGAMSDTQIDNFTAVFKQTTDIMPILVTPETAAVKRKQIKNNELRRISFSPDLSLSDPLFATLGMDFITWLWFDWEKNGGVHDSFSYMLEGPITFFNEGEGAFKVVISNGTPIKSSEFISALVCGKKLKKVKFTIAHCEKVYAVTVDDEFSFRSMKLPKIEMDSSEVFNERMRLINLFIDDWFMLFDKFLDMRIDVNQWNAFVNDIRELISSRA